MPLDAASPTVAPSTAPPSTEGPPPASSIAPSPPSSYGPTPAGGPSIYLALDRIPARGARVASLVVNPGGPGVSAVDTLPAIATLLSPAIRDHFDLIGYDPPGVGHSDAVTCLDDAGLAAYLHEDPAPPGPGGFAETVASARSFARACQEHSGALLGHVSTDNAARDLDRVRVAVGDRALTFLGFSYGTLLGATYASMYPTHVRALALDGAIDPALDPLSTLEAQAVAVDAGFREFAGACRGKRCRWRSGRDPTSTYLALLARTRAAPLRAEGPRRVGPAELLYGTAEALYSPSEWPALDRALADAERGDGRRIIALFDRYVGRTPAGSYQTTVEAETAVNCTDTASPTLAAIEAAAGTVSAKAPVFGPFELDAEATCALWPVQVSSGHRSVLATGAPPILVVGSTGDPITPYTWAADLAVQLGSGVLLTRVGGGHTAYGASSCVRRVVDAYLLEVRPPPIGTRCSSP